MKKKCFIFALLLSTILLAFTSFAQTAAKSDTLNPIVTMADSSKTPAANDTAKSPRPIGKGQFDIGATFNNYAGRYIAGMNIGFERFFGKWGTGLSFNIASAGINEDFGYNVARPSVLLLLAEWQNEYCLHADTNLRFGPVLNLNFMGSELYDPDHQVRRKNKYGTYYWTDTTVARNSFFDIEPGFSLSYRLFWDTWLTLRYKYRILIGGAEFGKQSDFSGSVYLANLSFLFDIYPSRPKKKRK